MQLAARHQNPQLRRGAVSIRRETDAARTAASCGWTVERRPLVGATPNLFTLGTFGASGTDGACYRAPC